MVLLHIVFLSIVLTQLKQLTASSINATGTPISRNGQVARLFGHSKVRNNHSQLQFRFNSVSHINGWWCVRMLEPGTISWDDNYLCTNRDIGLVFSCNNGYQCNPNFKCTSTLEPAVEWWYDNALCLPIGSNVELAWSYCGSRGADWKCELVYDPASSSAFNDDYICWKEH
ncbi:unnamed protein product [Rotaria magnacalcarata]|uniref:Uncharacterized protein n=1 Tax=Rotaria magnacalcarata TaxID=392030 RepID=A0A816N3U5_9BILA|nr:unnamed protein product [Rotaria magnacalcarata]CAF2050293.1 unnamed protein product [Rotaria magnacalcarata]